MTKEDFQHMDKHLPITNGTKYPTQIFEENEQLVSRSVDRPSHDKAEKWKHIERAANSHGQKKSTKGDSPWHALAEVKKEEAPKTHVGWASGGRGGATL
ncbi:hypothetical protein H2200_001907 [Cladophialophora chaetospira]|uniref:Uncharacterized protein n=1 Tax=Cladophialophora chaetospira TaxID=386627 RepID=A0AA38XMM4_9EURO|nr:hypothetical protein H2200_001907 [Cladophialophora chaetospira]